MAGKATIKSVLSGDTVIIVGAAKANGPPPTMQLSLASIKAPMMAMRSTNTQRDDELGAWESRECLRKMCIGQVVDFKVDYEFNGRKYATIKREGKNLAAEVVRAGLARVLPKKDGGASSCYEELTAADEEAQANNAGLHGSMEAPRKTLWSTEDEFDAEAFFVLNKGKTVKAMVDSCRDAGCYRCIIYPDEAEGGVPKGTWLHIPIFLAGVSVDSFKRNAEGNEEQTGPYAAESRHFVEMRLLQREIKVQINATDKMNNIYGSLIHPNGNVAALLLKNGLAKIADWTARSVDNVAELRQAETSAKKAKLKKWKDFVASVQDAKKYPAKVIEVVSGDCIVCKGEDGEEKRLYMASIRSPKPGTVNRAPEPWAHEAKEFCRKKLKGKKITVQIEYARTMEPNPEGRALPPPSDAAGKYLYASIFWDNKGQQENLGTTLCRMGYARVPQFGRGDDEKSQFYDEMIEAEKEAEEAKKGVHGKDANLPRVNDLVGPANSARAKSMENSLQRLGKVDGVVEHCFSGSRFKIRVPKENVYCAFSLGGCTAPATARPNDPSGKDEGFARESLAWAREHLMQMDVQIKIIACNRGGTMIGQMWVKGEDVAPRLLSQGLAYCGDYIDSMPSANQLWDTQEKAKARKIGLWSLDENHAEEADNTEQLDQDVTEDLGPCIVSYITSPDDFFLQKEKSQINAIGTDINAAMRSGEAKDLGQVSRGAQVMAKFADDGQWYRGRVEKRVGSGAMVFFLDFGNTAEIAGSDLKQLPRNLSTSAYPPQAIRCSLSGCASGRDTAKEAYQEFEYHGYGQTHAVTSERMRNGKKCVVLRPVGEKLSVNEELVKQGLCRVPKDAKTSLLADLKKHEAAAKKQHLAMWRYGDCGDGDEEDDRRW